MRPRGWPVRGMFSPLSAGLVPDLIRRFAVRDLPGDVALVEIDRGDAAVRRLDQRQALHRQAGGPPFTAAACRTLRAARRRRRPDRRAAPAT